MTVRELMTSLVKLPPDQEAKVFIRVHTRAHSVAQVTPFDVDAGGIWISLPENMHVVERKEKTQ